MGTQHDTEPLGHAATRAPRWPGRPVWAQRSCSSSASAPFPRSLRSHRSRPRCWAAFAAGDGRVFFDRGRRRDARSPGARCVRRRAALRVLVTERCPAAGRRQVLPRNHGTSTPTFLPADPKTRWWPVRMPGRARVLSPLVYLRRLLGVLMTQEVERLLAAGAKVDEADAIATKLGGVVARARAPRGECEASRDTTASDRFVALLGRNRSSVTSRTLEHVHVGRNWAVEPSGCHTLLGDNLEAPGVVGSRVARRHAIRMTRRDRKMVGDFGGPT